MSNEMPTITYRRAEIDDLPSIVEFVDFWLSGRGKKNHIKNTSNDYFITRKQHIDYISKYFVLVGIENSKIIAWGVSNQKKVLFHLLVAGTHRGRGIGRELLNLLNPEVVRSKTDQQTGDPTPWYLENGFNHIVADHMGKKKNITILSKS